VLIDTHAHLDYPDYDPDRPDVLQRAVDAGVTRLISIGTDVESSQRAVKLAEAYPFVYAAVGVHPNEAENCSSDFIERVRSLTSHPKVVAIGEVGLDYHRLPEPEKCAANQARQAEVFEAQLRLASEVGLNVVIHQRDSWDDTLKILTSWTGRLRGVFHCFGGTMAQAQEVFSKGHLVSFTGIVTFKNAAQVQESARALSQDHFMVETDCPYLAPVPFRGKRCEPAYTRLVAEKIAALRGTTLEEIARQTTLTAESFFRFNKNRS